MHQYPVTPWPSISTICSAIPLKLGTLGCSVGLSNRGVIGQGDPEPIKMLTSPRMIGLLKVGLLDWAANQVSLWLVDMNLFLLHYVQNSVYGFVCISSSACTLDSAPITTRYDHPRAGHVLKNSSGVGTSLLSCTAAVKLLSAHMAPCSKHEAPKSPETFPSLKSFLFDARI